MQGAQEIVGNRLGMARVGLLQETPHRLQMGLGLGAKDVQQLGIGFATRAGGRGLIDDLHRRQLRFDQGLDRGRHTFGQGFVACQGVGGVGQPVDVVTLPLPIFGVFLDQLRQQRTGLLDHRLQGGTVIDAMIQPAIEQILQCPGQFADDQRLDHAAAALERMEIAPQFAQRGALLGIGLPGRQPALQLRLDLAGLLDKDLAQFFLDRFGIGRRGQQRLRHLRRGRIDGVDRCGQHLGDRLRIGGHGRLAVQLASRQPLFGFFVGSLQRGG